MVVKNFDANLNFSDQINICANMSKEEMFYTQCLKGQNHTTKQNPSFLGLKSA